MPIQQQSQFCPHCNRQTLHARDVSPMPFNEATAHGCAMLLTCGLWLIPLIVISYVNSPYRRPFHCQVCGWK